MLFSSALFVYAETTEEYLARVGGKIEINKPDADSGATGTKEIRDGAARGAKNDTPVLEMQALAEQLKAAKNNPDSIKAYADMQNKITEDIKPFTAAIERNPGDAKAYCKRGACYVDSYTGTSNLSGSPDAVDNVNAAIADYTKAIELDQNYTEAYSMRGGAYLSFSSIPGQELDSLKNYFAKGIDDYTKVIELKPGQAVAYSCRAFGYFLMEDYARAWDDIHKAQQLGNPPPPALLQSLKKYSGRDE